MFSPTRPEILPMYQVHKNSAIAGGSLILILEYGAIVRTCTSRGDVQIVSYQVISIGTLTPDACSMPLVVKPRPDTVVPG